MNDNIKVKFIKKQKINRHKIKPSSNNHDVELEKFINSNEQLVGFMFLDEDDDNTNKKTDNNTNNNTDNKIYYMVDSNKPFTECMFLDEDIDDKINSDLKNTTNITYNYNKQEITSKNEKKDKKKKKSRKNTFKLQDNITPEYLCRLLGVRQTTIQKMETQCRLYPKENILSCYSPLKEMDYVSYYLITRNIMVYECSQCQLKPIWNDKPLYLLLDHINNRNQDCSLNNLRFLCPNCHTQIRGSKKIKHSASSAVKQTCIQCSYDFPTKDMRGGMCLTCIHMNNEMKLNEKNFQYNQYKKIERKINFDIPVIDHTKIIKDDLVPINMKDQISTNMLLQNEEKKSVVKLNCEPIPEKKPKTNKLNFDMNKSLFEQIMSMSSKNKKQNSLKSTSTDTTLTPEMSMSFD